MQIQWFPGHMTRALRDMKAKLKLVDVVLELADARLPRASRNPEIAKLLRQKPSLLLLTKADLADPEQTEAWQKFFASRGQASLAIDSYQPKARQLVLEKARLQIADKLERAEEKGRIGRPVRAMLVGIPNVGKSTLINGLVGRKAAVTSDRPGVTRAPQWVRAGQLELMDMPGVLWPKIEFAHDQLVLAATGAIRDQVLDIEEVAFRMFGELLERYPQQLLSRYKLEAFYADFLAEQGEDRAEFAEDPSFAQPPLLHSPATASYLPLYEEAIRRRGCVLKGNRLDGRRFASLFLDDLRAGQIGRLTLEQAPEVPQEVSQ